MLKHSFFGNLPSSKEITPSSAKFLVKKFDTQKEIYEILSLVEKIAISKQTLAL